MIHIDGITGTSVGGVPAKRSIITSFKSLLSSLRGNLGDRQASPESDPMRWLAPLLAMPNPDPILREIGQAERVYFSILSDPHVLGDLRSIHGNFRSHDFRVLEGADGDSKSLAAQQLCEQWMQRNAPNTMTDWLGVMWQMSSAFATGYRPHEVVWQFDSGKYLPQEIIDIPNRRFRFNAYGEPLLVSKTNLMGEPVEPYRYVISRHMADSTNPYGIAVLSSCFWAWTFKSNGWRYFVKYCERHGLPWPVGRYPLGTNDDDQNKLAQALAGMIEAGYVVAPDGTGLELLVPKGGAGELPQQALIELANREMSKAMTGQAMVSELHGQGARAASETAAARQASIDDSVRDIAAQSINQVFQWITLFNFGEGVTPPKLDFFLHINAGKERAETYQIAADMGARPSKSAMLEELGIPEAETDDDALLPSPKPAPNDNPAGPEVAAAAATGAPGALALSASQLKGIAGFEFAQAAGMTDDQALELASQAADRAIEDHMIEPIALMLAQYEAQGKTLAQFHTDLQAMVGAMDSDALREVIDRSLSYSILRGAATNAA